jgi:hypothetical protein
MFQFRGVLVLVERDIAMRTMDGALMIAASHLPASRQPKCTLAQLEQLGSSPIIASAASTDRPVTSCCMRSRLPDPRLPD